MKSFLIKTSMLGLPLILLVMAVNYFGDAGRLFSSNYENKIVAILLSNRAATNIGNYNERLMQVKWIEKLPDTPEVVVLGSSKAMLINKEMLNGCRLINNSVAGATLSDIEDVWGHYLALKKFPRKIILEINPWLLNPDILERSQNKHSNKHKTANVAWAKGSSDTVLSLFSPSYFRYSLSTLFWKIKGKDDPVPTLRKYNTTSTRCADGSFTYSDEYRNGDEAVVRSRVEIYFKRGDISDVHNLSSFDAGKWDRLNRMLDQMQQHKIQVTLFLTPFYPKVYQLILDNFPAGLSTEHLLAQMAEGRKMMLIGSYDPRKCGLSEDCFYDAVHCNEKGIRLLLKDFNTGFVAANASAKR